ncbi:MAG: outer membrane beta-barrel protein [Xanthobacteraceae bacterium]
MVMVGCFSPVAALAQDAFVASLRLRGGTDSNPVFATGGGVGGSVFVGAETALAAGGAIGDLRVAVAAEGATMRYANPAMPTARTGKVLLRGTLGDEALRADITTTFSDADTYTLRSSDLTQAIKLQARHGDLKLFVTAEGGLTRLNQTNAIFPYFFPTPHQFWRATLIPGMSIVRGKTELGFSVNLSARRYAEEFDIFGYARNNERLEPFLFARHSGEELTAFGALSWLSGRWHDPDFSAVDRLLFDAILSWKPKPFTIDLAASRRASETTFPISPITIDTLYSAKASWQIDADWALRASAGYAEIEYLDSDFRARTLSYGIGVTRDLGHDIKLGFDLTRMRGKLISGEPADAVIVAASLSRRFAPGGAAKADVRTGAPPVR